MEESALSISEIHALKQFGFDRRIRVEKIGIHFMQRGTLGLWWDTKLSEEDKKTWWYFYLCLIRLSDKTAVLSEVQRYIDFYKCLENLTFLSSEEIDTLDNEVKHFLLQTKIRMETTRSKTIYDICKELVSSKVERNIEKIRNAIGSHEFQKLKNKFDEVLKKEAEEWGEKTRLELDTLTECSRVKAEEAKKKSENLAQEIQKIDNRMTAMHSTLVGIVHRLREELHEDIYNVVMD